MIASMGLQTMLLICSAQAAFSPKSGDELKGAVDTCLEDANTMKLDDSDTENSKYSFTFVLIPVHKDDPIREVIKPIIFGPRDDDIKSYAMEHFGYSEDSESDVIETLKLDFSGPENVVIMYSERKAQIDMSLVNKRATELASACLTVPHVVHGDVIVGRHINNQERYWVYLDFFKHEADKNAEWVADAAAGNARLGEKQFHDDMANPNSRGKEGPVSWNQNDEDVEIIVELPKGVKGRDISVIIKYNSIKIGLKNGHTFPEESVKDNMLLKRLLAGLEPAEIIDPDLSTWSLTDGQLMIALTKRESEIWHSLYK